MGRCTLDTPVIPSRAGSMNTIVTSDPIYQRSHGGTQQQCRSLSCLTTTFWSRNIGTGTSSKGKWQRLSSTLTTWRGRMENPWAGCGSLLLTPWRKGEGSLKGGGGTVTSFWDNALPLGCLKKKGYLLTSHFLYARSMRMTIFSHSCISFQQQYCGPAKAIFLCTDPTGLDWVVSSSSLVDLAYITQLILAQTHFEPEDKGSIFLRNAGMHLKYYLSHSSRS